MKRMEIEGINEVFEAIKNRKMEVYCAEDCSKCWAAEPGKDAVEGIECGTFGPDDCDELEDFQDAIEEAYENTKYATADIREHMEYLADVAFGSGWKPDEIDEMVDEYRLTKNEAEVVLQRLEENESEKLEELENLLDDYLFVHQDIDMSWEQTRAALRDLYSDEKTMNDFYCRGEIADERIAEAVNNVLAQENSKKNDKARSM